MKSVRYKNWKILTTCIGLLVGLLTACSTDEPEPELIGSLTVGLTPFIGEAALFVADEKGFFRDEGLEVTLKVNNSGRESVRQLLSGEIEIAHVAETPILYTIMDPDYVTGEKVGELQILANMIHANRIQSVLARRDAGIEEPQDIRGKRVALAGGTQSEFHLDSFLLEHQVAIHEIDTVHLPVHKQVAAIIGGEVDAVTIWEPHVSYIHKQIGDNAIELPTRLTYSTLWLVTTLDQFAEQHPELLTAYLRALRSAQRYILKEPLWTIELLSDRISVPYDVIYDAIRQLDYELTLTERMLNHLLEQQRWMAEKGLVEGLDIEIFERIHFRFLEEVYPEGISLIR